jgi:hypothetical protein
MIVDRRSCQALGMLPGVSVSVIHYVEPIYT